MKKVICSLIVVGVVAGLLLVGAPPSQAQAPVPTPTIDPNTNVVSFGNLRVGEITLHGPYDSADVLLGLPANWSLGDGVAVQLVLGTFYGGAGLATAAPAPLGLYGGALEVSFNNALLTTVPLDQSGDRTVTIPIPPEALAAVRRDGRHSLGFFLDAAFNCEFDAQTVVVIRTASLFTLPHDLTAPTTDLTRLPRPIFQNSFVPDTATIVVANQPTLGELQAALSVAAGFGRMTSGNLLLSFVTVDQLTSGIVDANHLIFVGLPASLPLLGEVGLPAPVSGNSYNAAGANPDDGIIQMAVSPWNSARVVLVVGGNGEAGVIKAGQALSTGQVRVGQQVDLAVVAEVKPEFGSRTLAVDQTLAEMGYPDTSVSTIGANIVQHLFAVPPGQTGGDEAYFELLYAHSTLLEYDRSSIVVYLNDQPVGSIRFSDETASRGTMRMALPRNLLRSGVNRLDVVADLVPRDVCADPRLAGLWARIDSTSLLHLPLSLLPGGVPPPLDLNLYPEPFSLGPMLSSVAFVVAPNDPLGWSAAAGVAYDLGNRSRASLVNLVALYGDAVSDDVRQTRDLIVVGRPSAVPLLSELGEALPAPFDPGSDLAVERRLQVAYRVQPGVSLGYLELLAAPWNSQRAVLAVLGSTDSGVQWAASALTASRLRRQLSGNFAVINGEHVVVSDTRLGPGAPSALATAIPGGVIQVPVAQPAPIAQRPAWILPTLAAVILLMLLILSIVAMRAIVQRRSGAK